MHRLIVDGPAARGARAWDRTGVIIFLVWMWITNLALLIGAEFNAELERRHSANQNAARADS
jgi:hypothetical protein